MTKITTQLASCPNSPNCVSTRALHDVHKMAAIDIPKIDFKNALNRARNIILSWPRTKIMAATDTYLHVTQKSAFFGFIDDIEIELDSNENKMHFRSCSRIGYSDFGVNRKRMEVFSRAMGGAS